jgi:hypothetical protein
MSARLVRLRWALAMSALALVGTAIGSTWAAYSATTTNGANSFSVAAADATDPVISRQVVAKTDGTAGTIRQGGDYYVYAQATDNVAVATVTANTSSFDSGVTAASMSSGSWTIAGQTYNYRSAVLTASTPLNTGTSYSYSVTATDGAGNDATANGSVSIETYQSVITATSGLVSYWRMGVAATGADNFTGSAGATLQSHTGEVSTSWTKFTGSDAVLSDANRLRRNATGASHYYASTTPASANYAVIADVVVRSMPTGSVDAVGVVGRQDTSNVNGTYYLARYYVDSTQWTLDKIDNGTQTNLGTYSQTLSAGDRRRLRLEMNGSTISLYVDGILRITATDSTISAAGKAGARLGTGGSTNTPTNTTGLHLDNFRVVANTGTTLTDSHGANNGTLSNSPLLNEPGALAGDFNGAMQFDGTNDYASVPDAASLDLGDGPLTLEAWVQRVDTPAGWHDIFDKGTGAYQVGFFGTEFDLAKDGTGVVSGATGAASDTTGFHHWVVTKSGTSTKLYRDGVDVTGTITDYTLTNTATALYIASKNGSSEFLNARLDELAVYNQVLSSTTVLDHYEAGVGTG